MKTAICTLLLSLLAACGGNDEPETRAREGIHPEQCAPQQKDCQ